MRFDIKSAGSLLAVGLLLLASCSPPAMQLAQTPEPPRRAFLPVIVRSPDLPVIYGCDGEVEDAAWLVENFGAVSWTQGVSGTLAAIRACCGNCPAAIVVHVEPAREGVPVVLYWPDAPALPDIMWNCGLGRGVVGETNSAGDVGFGLGKGSYYEPPAGGPHTVWTVGGPCVEGLGMKRFTNHEHLDLDIYQP